MSLICKLIRRLRTSVWYRRRVLRRIERTTDAVRRAELNRATLAASYLGQARQEVSWEIAQQVRRQGGR